MNQLLRSIPLLVSLPLLAFFAADSTSFAQGRRPNIVLILADDMGYGDVGAFNPGSRIGTPNIDRLASEGMRFTRAHSPGSWCVPTRYGLMTGRYPFRRTLSWRARAVVDAKRPTIATLLAKQGYRTGMVGKWHLGFDGGIEFDYSKPLRGGPVDRGFRQYFGIHASLDIPPYFYVRGDSVVQAPTATADDNNTGGWTRIQGAFWRRGPRAPDFVFEEVLPTLEKEAVRFVAESATARPADPFFLYFALPAPHTPWLPLKKYVGTSGASMYGDFVAQVDATVGAVMKALDSHDLADDTIFLFTSDNGPVWYPDDERRFGHRSGYVFRGMKGDAWDGGHHMPFIVRWPKLVRAGSECHERISFTDVYATLASILGAKLEEGVAEDSFDFTPLLRGEKPSEPRGATVVQSSRGFFAVMDGDWKLITGLGSGGFSKPSTIRPTAGGPIGQLYNVTEDPSETDNRYAREPEIVERLSKLLHEYRKNGRSRPR